MTEEQKKFASGIVSMSGLFGVACGLFVLGCGGNEYLAASIGLFGFLGAGTALCIYVRHYD